MNKESLKIDIEEWLKKHFENKGSYNEKIYEAMYYSISVGGKRIRPILFILTYSIYKDNYKQVLPVAGALEMIHTYSLIHDDLPSMDNDDLRRNMPTNHKVFGEGMAILAGDGLLNEAMNVMFEYCLAGDRNSLKACNLISASAGTEGMIGGQVVDILSEGKNISSEELNYMHSKKTGALIRSSIISGGILGGASEDELEILSSFGEKLGLAFQIKDDILDVIGSTEILGKKINSDTDNNKTTYVTLYGIEKCKEISNEITKECLELLDKLKGDVEELKALTVFLLERNF